MADIIQMRRDIEQNWILSNPLLSDGELAFTTDTNPKKIKMGDGTTRWNNLDYLSGLKGEKGDKGDAGIGTGDMLASTYDPVIKSITGKTSGTVNADKSLADLFNLVDTKTAIIPVDWLYAFYRADRSRTYNKVYVDCHDKTGSSQNPTSFVVTVSVNGAVVYTSPAVTTASFTATVELTINGGDAVLVAVSNTAGVTGDVTVSLGMVNR